MSAILLNDTLAHNGELSEDGHRQLLSLDGERKYVLLRLAPHEWRLECAERNYLPPWDPYGVVWSPPDGEGTYHDVLALAKKLESEHLKKEASHDV